MQPEPLLLDQLVERIVAAVHPLRIILFGSAARGEVDHDSDIDLLVVMPDGTHRRRIAQELQTYLHGFPYDVDVIVATPHDLTMYGQRSGFVYSEALRDGREIYAA